MVRFGSTSGQSIFGPIRLSCQNKQLGKNFGSGIVRFGSIRISGSLSGKHILGAGSRMGPGRSVHILDLGSVLPGLFLIAK